MARTVRFDIEIEDVKGSFKRMCEVAPKKAREFLSRAVLLTTAGVLTRMETAVPVDQGDLKTALTMTHKGLHGRAGVLDDPDQAEVAVFNEYAPNRQPFMKPSAEAESNDFKKRAEYALEQMERYLSQGF